MALGASYSCKTLIINSALIKDTGDVLRTSMTIGIVIPGTNLRTAAQTGSDI